LQNIHEVFASFRQLDAAFLRIDEWIHGASRLTVNGRLGLQPISFHVETLFPAQVCVQRESILAATSAW
jgi:hypothetical protein